MNLLEEISDQLDSTTDVELFPASDGKANKKFTPFTVIQLLQEGEFIASNGTVAIGCHGPGGHFEIADEHPFINQIRYRGNSVVERPEVELQDVILSTAKIPSATIIWATRENYERVSKELLSVLE